MGRRCELPIAERAREPDTEHLPVPRSAPVTRITSSSSALPTRNAGCVAQHRGAKLFVAGISTSGDSIFITGISTSGGEALPHLGRRFRVLLPSESAPFQLILPTKWIRAVSWPPHALTRVCVLEERRGAQGDTTWHRNRRDSARIHWQAATPGCLAAALEAQEEGVTSQGGPLRRGPF
jgi:hypothetical protein